VWELFTSERILEEGLSIGQIFYMSEWGERVHALLIVTSYHASRHHEGIVL
jgi:hypothetical protein